MRLSLPNTPHQRDEWARANVSNNGCQIRARVRLDAGCCISPNRLPFNSRDCLQSALIVSSTTTTSTVPVPSLGMVTYPTGLSQVNEEYASTPTHGGTVNTGHEFDMAITEKIGGNQLHPLPTTVQPAQAQRRLGASSQRPRPVSMPPQSYGQSYGPVPAERERQPAEENSKRQHSRDQSTHRVSRGSSRVLGDYTLGKTLGAGSMGKVKLAQHANSDEKVRPLFDFFEFIRYLSTAPARYQNSASRHPKPQSQF